MPASPGLTLQLHLGAPLAPLIEGEGLAQSSLIQALEAELTERIGSLGIAGTPEIDVVVDQSQPKPARWLVHGRECRYPDELPISVLAFLRGEVLGARAEGGENKGWADDLRSLVLDDQMPLERLIQFFRVFAGAVIEQCPSVLLGHTEMQAYAAVLREKGLDGASDLTDESVGHVLREVLHMGLSLADTERVVTRLAPPAALSRPASEHSDRAEALIAELTPETIEIRARREFIQRFSLALVDDKKLMLSLHGRLFYELGIRLPPFRFVASGALPDRGFEFRIQDWTVLPRIGLAPDELLVNDTVDRLKRLNINGRPAINPANNTECSIIETPDRAAAEDAGLTTWNEHGYLALCLLADLRLRSGRLVTARYVDSDLDLLAGVFPDLVDRAREKLSVGRITRVLRLLVSEGVSIRNLRRILERLLEFDHIHCDPGKLIVFDDRMPTSRVSESNWIDDPDTLAGFVRTGVRRYISHQIAWDGTAIVVFLLDAEIEQLLREHKARGSQVLQTESERLLAALGEKLDKVSPTARVPVLLTTIEIRSLLRKLIKTRFPRLGVVCYQELRPGMNIQPIARISLA